MCRLAASGPGPRRRHTCVDASLAHPLWVRKSTQLKRMSTCGVLAGTKAGPSSSRRPGIRNALEKGLVELRISTSCFITPATKTGPVTLSETRVADSPLDTCLPRTLLHSELVSPTRRAPCSTLKQRTKAFVRLSVTRTRAVILVRYARLCRLSVD